MSPKQPVFDLAAHLEAGFVFAKRSDQPGIGVVGPDGRYGHGPTHEDAVANIGAQIIPDPVSGRRVLYRADGTHVVLDVAPADGER